MSVSASWTVMVTRSLKDARLPENDHSHGSDDAARKADRSSSESEVWVPNEHIRLLLSLVTKLERNWTLSAALILGAITIASVL